MSVEIYEKCGIRWIKMCARYKSTAIYLFVTARVVCRPCIHCSVNDWILNNVRITRCIGPLLYCKCCNSSITHIYTSNTITRKIYFVNIHNLTVKYVYTNEAREKNRFGFVFDTRKHVNIQSHTQTHARRINSSFGYIWYVYMTLLLEALDSMWLHLSVCELNKLNHTVYETSKCDSWLPI